MGARGAASAAALTIILMFVVAPAGAAPQEAPRGEQTVPEIPDVDLVPAFPQLTFVRPVCLAHAGDGSGRLFVVEQPGRIRVVEPHADVTEAKIFLDLKEAVFDRHNEEGLLALAFHPRFEDNGQLFVYYNANDPRRGVVSRFRVDANDPDRADPASEEVILEVEQPYGNHNGSTLLFGPDGYLYISLGDGGAANDPHDHGQNKATLLGTILRIDVDRPSGGKPYGIPDDNPFVDDPDARPEIWAYGLRNVWRMSFDRDTGDLWAGDVGQVRWEEIDVIKKGGNYGWRLREGTHPFRDGEADGPLIEPVLDYGRHLGMSVTGGYVYRGSAHPSLRGVYLYADYVTGRMWGLRYADGKLLANREVLGEHDRKHVTSFGEGPDGELYVCTFDRLDRRGGTGKVFRVVGAP